MSKIFLDTNVPVLAQDKAVPAKQKHAQGLLRGVTQSHDVYLSTQVLQEFYNTLTKKLGVDKRVARRKMELLSSLQVIITDVPVILAATLLHESASLSF